MSKRAEEELKRTEEYIKKLVDACTRRLEELYNSKMDKLYVEGEKIAYVNILNVIKRNDSKNIYNLDYDIEERFPTIDMLETRHEN